MFAILLLITLVTLAKAQTNCLPIGWTNEVLTPAQATALGWKATDWQCIQPCTNPGSSLWARAYENGTIRCEGGTQPQEGLGSCQWYDNNNCTGSTKPSLNSTSGYTCRSYQYDWCGPARNQLQPQIYPGLVGTACSGANSTTYATCTTSATAATPTTTVSKTSQGEQLFIGLLGLFLVVGL